ncbi:MAG: B12-binding domain-containing radical SAM protein [Candidatus Acidulodesulfobacterium ferriphilum]|uniref:B12-binding domain-containing radical SAM protein n=1 Tax=Candidatus Acidulodesulfobacterium ferriphilum TaxID=2597223 RepID=A0A519BAE5_9DELT|nr:MAG: B12-binding domain-containing radical SAM protein [Candidatus Acidulodesulfobacterium ferriphilum]
MVKNKKLLLISLRDPFLDSDRVMPPIGVMSLQSYMLSLGFDSKIENDFDLYNIDKYHEYTHFAISCMTPQKKQAYSILNIIKLRFNDKSVIIGGPHTQYYLEDCVKEPFDYIIVGDGEYSLRAVIEGKASQRILNIPITSAEMNKLPVPYREPEFLKQYNFNIQGINASTILTAKGCPMSCAFCEDAGTKVRLYNPENIDIQIKDVLNAGFKGIMFFDDIFAISKKRIKDLVYVIGRYNISFRCFGHAKSMTDEMAKLLSDSGCIEVGFGAESGSQRILSAINKRTTVEENIKFIEICNKYGIRVKAFIIIGLPGEDFTTIEETKKFLDILLSNKFTNKFGKEVTNDFDITVYFPYKGTKIRSAMDKNSGEYDIYFSQNPDDLQGFYKGRGGSTEISVRTSLLDSGLIQKTQKELLTEYKRKVINH